MQLKKLLGWLTPSYREQTEDLVTLSFCYLECQYSSLIFFFSSFVQFESLLVDFGKRMLRKSRLFYSSPRNTSKTSQVPPFPVFYLFSLLVFFQMQSYLFPLTNMKQKFCFSLSKGWRPIKKITGSNMSLKSF